MLQISYHNAGMHTLGDFLSPEKGSVNGPSIAFNLLQKLLRYLGCFETIDIASKLPPRAPTTPNYPPNRASELTECGYKLQDFIAK